MSHKLGSGRNFLFVLLWTWNHQQILRNLTRGRNGDIRCRWVWENMGLLMHRNPGRHGCFQQNDHHNWWMFKSAFRTRSSSHISRVEVFLVCSKGVRRNSCLFVPLTSIWVEDYVRRVASYHLVFLACSLCPSMMGVDLLLTRLVCLFVWFARNYMNKYSSSGLEKGQEVANKD